MRDLYDTSINKSPRKTTFFSNFKFALSNLVSLKGDKEKKRNFSDNESLNVGSKNLIHLNSHFSGNQALCINNEASLMKMKEDQDMKELNEKYTNSLEKNEKLAKEIEEMQHYINQLHNNLNSFPESSSPQLRHRKNLSSLNIMDIKKNKNYFEEKELYTAKKQYCENFIIVEEEIKRKFLKKKPLILYTNFFEIKFNMIRKEQDLGANEIFLSFGLENKEEELISKLEIDVKTSQSNFLIIFLFEFF